MRKTDVKLPEFEVTVLSKSCYEIKKVISAKNEYVALLEMANCLSGDFDFYFNDDDYEVVNVIRVTEEWESNENSKHQGF